MTPTFFVILFVPADPCQIFDPSSAASSRFESKGLDVLIPSKMKKGRKSDYYRPVIYIRLFTLLIFR